MRTWKLIAVMLTGVLVGGTGCAQTVDIQFDGPAGSTMTLDDQAYDLPETLTLDVPTDNALMDGPMSRRKDVTFTFPVGGDDAGQGATDTLAAEGVLDLFKFNETDVDRYARNVCPITAEHVQRMRDGYAVVIDGHTASGQRLFRLTMGER